MTIYITPNYLASIGLNAILVEQFSQSFLRGKIFFSWLVSTWKREMSREGYSLDITRHSGASQTLND